jgi:hypothetical protein
MAGAASHATAVCGGGTGCPERPVAAGSRISVRPARARPLSCSSSIVSACAVCAAVGFCYARCQYCSARVGSSPSIAFGLYITLCCHGHQNRCQCHGPECHFGRCDSRPQPYVQICCPTPAVLWHESAIELTTSAPWPTATTKHIFSSTRREYAYNMAKS